MRLDKMHLTVCITCTYHQMRHFSKKDLKKKTFFALFSTGLAESGGKLAFVGQGTSVIPFWKAHDQGYPKWY